MSETGGKSETGSNASLPQRGWTPLLRKWGYLPYDFPSVETLADEADRKLLRSLTQCQYHVLRHLLKGKPTPVRSLRAIGRLTLSYILKRTGILYRGHYTMLSDPGRGTLTLSKVLTIQKKQDLCILTNNSGDHIPSILYRVPSSVELLGPVTPLFSNPDPRLCDSLQL